MNATAADARNTAIHHGRNGSAKAKPPSPSAFATWLAVLTLGRGALVVAEVVKMAFEAGAKQVVVTDASCNEANRCFQRSGIWRAAYALGAHCDRLSMTPAGTLELVRAPTPQNQAELAWRLGLALAAINFVLLAVTVSSVNPRVGRSGNLVFALFSFVVYFNLLNLGQSWIGRERMGFAAFLLVLHGGTFAFATLWLAKQHNNWGWRPLLRRLGGRSA